MPASITVPDDPRDISPKYKDWSEEDALKDIRKKLKSRRWRLNHLYRIQDVKGRDIQFRMNYAQKLLYLSLWFLNIILKSRQHGITTFMCLLGLDLCLFNSNYHAAIIAHNKDDASDFFVKKVKFAYDRLPTWFKESVPKAVETSEKKQRDATNVMSFANGSSIRVTTSGRSGTYQFIHISEFGKMCAKYPAKAEEVIGGTLNAIHEGQMVTIESTAEGKEGRFFEMSEDARKVAETGRELGNLEWKFHFFGALENELNYTRVAVPVPKRLTEYFDRMETKLKRSIPDEFRWWYTSKEKTQGDLMKREHPLTPEEAFEGSLEGAYFALQMSAVRKGVYVTGQSQICPVPYQPNVLVSTFWDLGVGDYTAIWFAQMIGREIHVINYYENSGEGLLHYANYCKDLGYKYAQWWAPHDLINREFTTGKTRYDTAKGMGINFQISRRISKESQIELARQVIPSCWFDEINCEKGIAALDAYRKEWNDQLGQWRDKPRHDWASHGADAFMVLAMNIGGTIHNVEEGAPRTTRPQEEIDKDRQQLDPGGWT